MGPAQVTALLPALAWLEGRPAAGVAPIAAHLEVAPLESSVSSQQLSWLQSFVAALASTFVSDAGAAPLQSCDVMMGTLLALPLRFLGCLCQCLLR